MKMERQFKALQITGFSKNPAFERYIISWRGSLQMQLYQDFHTKCGSFIFSWQSS